MIITSKIFALPLLLLIVCWTGDVEAKQRELQPKTEAECQSRGGQWGVHPFSRQMMCFVKTRDADQPCRKSDDCDSAYCVAINGKTQPGACYGAYIVNGCIEQDDRKCAGMFGKQGEYIDGDLMPIVN